MDNWIWKCYSSISFFCIHAKLFKRVFLYVKVKPLGFYFFRTTSTFQVRTVLLVYYLRPYCLQQQPTIWQWLLHSHLDHMSLALSTAHVQIATVPVNASWPSRTLRQMHLLFEIWQNLQLCWNISVQLPESSMLLMHLQSRAKI